ncbi:hypothetical protein J1N35_012313 [Gossypium stocksii]|uniref:Reverse transcriptase domain-containing protein n=1 Tax=Gossypium stocksii TaxID=47602 RepID=A0A9D3W5W8_9ROSI|nr:hypothetical protein J1N35_012313 [Gossypium stocksii]
MVVKLDMSKAYDRVEWDFLREVMIKMGFAQKWVALIMKCITTASYAVHINGRRGEIFQPTRGLQQGDPLSPFLFLVCNEGLSSLIRLATRAGLLKGAKASRRGPEISHLLFADDCILFGEATKARAMELVCLEELMGNKGYFGERALLEDFKVAELINSEERKWKRELICNTFSHDVAEKILRIPLASKPHEDFMGDRNARIHDKIRKTGQQIVKFVLSYIKELDGVEMRTSKKNEPVSEWRYPPKQAVKINFDGAFDEELAHSASGVVARNSEGYVLLSCSEIHQHVYSSFAAEALACRKATQIGVDMGWHEIIIEGNSLSIIKKSKAGKQDKSQIGAYIHDIK